MCCFLCFLLFFVIGNSSWLSFCAPTSMVLDIVEGQGRGEGPKKAKIQYGVKPDIFKYAEFRRGIDTAELIGARYGLRGVRAPSVAPPISEVCPDDVLASLEADLTMLDSSDDEPLVRDTHRSDRLAQSWFDGQCIPFCLTWTWRLKMVWPVCQTVFPAGWFWLKFKPFVAHAQVEV